MWIKCSENTMPELHEKVWYHAPQVGTHYGTFEGYYVSEKGVTYKGMHIFLHHSGKYWLTGDVTHWHKDQEEEPHVD